MSKKFLEYRVSSEWEAKRLMNTLKLSGIESTKFKMGKEIVILGSKKGLMDK